MDPTLISAGVGLLSGMFGGGQKTDPNVTQNLQYINGILQRGISAYDNTDMNAQDAQTVGDYSTAAMQHAMAILGNYDAQAAGGGSALWKGDTQKDRSRTQIAGDAASQIAQLQANLDSTRQQRRAALLPSAGQAAAGQGDAMYLDQQQNARNAARTQGIMSAAQIVGSMFPGSDGTSSPAVAGGGSGPVFFGTDTSNLGYRPYTAPSSGGYGSNWNSGYVGSSKVPSV